MKQNVKCKIKYNGQQDGIHILTPFTSAGDEIGWNFVDLFMSNSQFTIGTYLEIMSHNYKAASRVSFMGRTCFTQWLFSWMASFKVWNIYIDKPIQYKKLFSVLYFTFLIKPNRGI